MKNLYEVGKEIIGQAIHDFMQLSSGRNPKEMEAVNYVLAFAEDSYTLIHFPEIQQYMEEIWFEEEACLADDSSYFIPNQRLNHPVHDTARNKRL
jgi:hypothetical protein